VGIGTNASQKAVAIVEPSTGFVEKHALDFEILPYLNLALTLRQLLRKSFTSPAVEEVLFYPQLPVDVRHNSKINREQLAAWAATRVDLLQTSNPRSLTGG
jgi:hypothetical protein